MIRYALVFVMLPTVALAQTAPAGMPAELVLKVTPDEVNTISEGLQTQPFGKVVPLMNKLRTQIQEQQPKPAEAPKEAPK